MHDHHSHHRRSIRLKGYDYSQPGGYFVTLVTWGRECLFGEIVNSEMKLNKFGEIAREEWLQTTNTRANVEIHEDEFVIMPNHIHGIIWIVEKDEDENVGATCQVAPTEDPMIEDVSIPKKSTTLKSISLGAIIGQYKTVSAKRINAVRGCRINPVWQRNYHEHIIRNEREWGAIRAYISNNPLN